MTKKNLKPQQAAPVQREINTTSSVVGGTAGLTPHVVHLPGEGYRGGDSPQNPFAGDDAE